MDGSCEGRFLEYSNGMGYAGLSKATNGCNAITRLQSIRILNKSLPSIKKSEETSLKRVPKSHLPPVWRETQKPILAQFELMNPELTLKYFIHYANSDLRKKVKGNTGEQSQSSKETKSRDLNLCKSQTKFWWVLTTITDRLNKPKQLTHFQPLNFANWWCSQWSCAFPQILDIYNSLKSTQTTRKITT